MQMPDVLDGVVRAGLKVAGRARRSGRGGRGAPAGRACGRRTRPPSRARPAPSPSSVEADADVGLLGLAVDLARRGSSLAIVPNARFHRSRVQLEPLGAGDRGGRPGELAGAAADPHLAEAAAEMRGRQPRGEPGGAVRSAGCGSSPRCSRRTRCAARPADEHAAGAGTPRARAPRRAVPTSSRCSGANAWANASARLERLGTSTSRASAPVSSAVAESAAEVVEQVTRSEMQRPPACRDRARPGPAGRVRASCASAPDRRDHEQIAGSREPVDPDVARAPGAWPPGRTGCPDRRSRRPPRRSPYRRRALRSPERRRSRRRGWRPQAGMRRAPSGRPRRLPRGSAHRDVAALRRRVRSPRPSRPCSGTALARRARRSPARPDGDARAAAPGAPSRSTTVISSRRPARATAPTFSIARSSPAAQPASSVERGDVQLGVGHLERRTARCRRCRSAACSRAAPRRRPSAPGR